MSGTAFYTKYHRYRKVTISAFKEEIYYFLVQILAFFSPFILVSMIRAKWPLVFSINVLFWGAQKRSPHAHNVEALYTLTLLSTFVSELLYIKKMERLDSFHLFLIVCFGGLHLVFSGVISGSALFFQGYIKLLMHKFLVIVFQNT